MPCEQMWTPVRRRVSSSSRTRGRRDFLYPRAFTRDRGVGWGPRSLPRPISERRGKIGAEIGLLVFGNDAFRGSPNREDNNVIISIENARIDFAKEFLVQQLHRFLRVASGYDETNIEQRSALRNHADIDARQSAECTRRHAWGVAKVISHDTNDRLALFDADLREFPQRLANFGQPRRIVYGQGNADFGARQHIHGGFRAAEKVSNAPEKSVPPHHPLARNIDLVKPSLSSRSPPDIRTGHRAGNDSRPGDVGTARV